MAIGGCRYAAMRMTTLTTSDFWRYAIFRTRVGREHRLSEFFIKGRRLSDDIKHL